MSKSLVDTCIYETFWSIKLLPYANITNISTDISTDITDISTDITDISTNIDTDIISVSLLNFTDTILPISVPIPIPILILVHLYISTLYGLRYMLAILQ